MVDSSGMKLKTTDLVLGACAVSQYSSLRLIVMFEPWFQLVNLNGPVPTGPAVAVP